MTDAEAVAWLRRRSCVLVMHEDRMIICLPDAALRVRVNDEVGFQISIPKNPAGIGGYVLAMSDPGDSLGEVAQAARVEWQTHVSAVDALADANASWRHAPAKLDFETDRELFK
jgi:hypothetical protein